MPRTQPCSSLWISKMSNNKEGIRKKCEYTFSKLIMCMEERNMQKLFGCQSSCPLYGSLAWAAPPVSSSCMHMAQVAVVVRALLVSGSCTRIEWSVKYRLIIRVWRTSLGAKLEGVCVCVYLMTLNLSQSNCALPKRKASFQIWHCGQYRSYVYVLYVHA